MAGQAMMDSKQDMRAFEPLEEEKLGRIKISKAPASGSAVFSNAQIINATKSVANLFNWPEKSVDEFLKNVDWAGIKQAQATRDGNYFSVAVEIEDKTRILTVGLGKTGTTLTISDRNGEVLAHAAQKGKEVTYFTPGIV